MKKTILSLLLAFSMLICTLLCFPMVIGGAGENGLSFESKNIYEASRKTDRTPTTFEAWIKLPRSAVGNRGGIILGNAGDRTCPCISFEVHYNGNPRLYWLGPNYETADCIFTDINVCTGEWVHLAIVRDKTKRKVHCYVDGELKSTIALPLKGVKNHICVEPFVLGGDFREGNVQYFKGNIRSVAIYNTVRTAEEIKNDMAKPALNDSLISYYDLTTGLNDLSGNGYDITKHSSMVWIPAAKKEQITDFDYTFAVIGDTQTVSYNYPEKFPLIYDWILENKDKKNIQFVMGLGDITDKSLDREWEVAMKNILRMKDAGIPFSLVRGNHDTVDTFNKYYPYNEYSSAVNGTYDESMINSWQKISAGNRNFIIFTLDYGPSDEILKWAEDIIEAHADHNIIITTHSYLYRDGTPHALADLASPSTSGGVNNGDDMWEKLIRKHENIVLVIGGHDPVSRIITAQDKGDNGNIVTQMLVDFQYEDSNQNGLGIVTLFHFSDDSDEIQIETYSTARKQYYKPRNQFSVTLDFVGEDPIDEDPIETDKEPESSEPTGSTASSESSIIAESSEAASVPDYPATSDINNTAAPTDPPIADNPSNSSGIILICGISASAALLIAAVVIVLIIKKKKSS